MIAKRKEPGFSRALGAAPSSLALLLGLTVLSGWVADSSLLIRLHGNFPAMNPMTAICFVLAGSSILLMLLRPDGEFERFVSSGFAIGIAIIGALRVIDCAFALHLDVDRLILPGKLSESAHLYDRMAPGTAILFVAMGLGLIFGIARQWGCHPISRVLALTTAFYSAGVLTGYAIQQYEPFGVTLENPMAVHTCVGFLLLATGLLATLRTLAQGQRPSDMDEPSRLWRFFDGRFEQKIASGFIAALFLLSLVGIASFVTMQQAIRNRGENRRCRMILDATTHIETGLKEVESAKRGFLLTSQESFVESLLTGRLKTIEACRSLQKLLKDDPAMGENVTEIIRLARSRIAHDKYVISLCKTDGLKAAIGFIKTGVGQGMVHRLHERIDRLETTARTMMTDREARAESSETAALTIVTFGTIAGVIVVIVASVMIRRDIVSKREAEFLLRSSEAKFRYLADSMSQVVWHMDPNGMLTYANAKWCDYVGKTPTSALRTEWKESVSWKDLPYFLENWRTAAAEERPFDGEYRLVRWIDEASRWHLCHGEPQHDDNGVIISWIFTWTDIEEHKQIEANLQQAKGAAENASEAKSQFLARMSHEIRTPLHGIIGMLDLLLNGDLKDKERRYSLMAKASAEALTSLINDILDFSKIEAGKMELNSTDFNLQATVEAVGDMITPRASKKNIEFGIYVDPAVPAVVQGDPDRLRQILVNLVGNSIKFTEKGSVTVEVSVERDAGEEVTLRFEVSDTGIGISPEDQKKLFHTFSQVDVSTTRSHGGTGLGLAISKQLAELMGGAIGVESVQGRGSKFWFRVPFKRVQPGSVAAIPAASLDPRGMRVLAVESRPTTRAMLQRQLEGLKLKADAAESASEALPRLTQAHHAGEPYRVALIDRDLPDLKVDELARKIKYDANLRDTVLMIMVSFDEAPDEEELRRLGFDGHLTKPIRQSQLFNAIMNALQAARTTNEAVLNPQPDKPELVAKNGRRILVVEDNEVNQIVATEILTRAGYTVTTASHGMDALRKTESERFDLVLMDCQMPVMDGFEATRTIRAREAKAESRNPDCRHLPIIALTANSIQGDRERCLSAGMDDYITKPLQPAKLIAAIESALKQNAMSAPASDSATTEQTGDVIAAKTDGSVDEPPAIDFDAISTDWPDNPKFRHQLLRKFIEKAGQDIEAMGSNMNRNDHGEVRRLAHGLKGAAGFVHANRLRGAATTLEEAAESSNRRLVESTLVELQHEFDRCMKQYSSREAQAQPD